MDSLMMMVILGAALAGFVQGLSGSNFGLVSTTVWAWALDPTLAAPLVVCGSLVGQMLAAGNLQRPFDRQRLLPMVIGGLLGVPLGVLLLHQVDPVIFRFMVGVLLIVWCPLMLLSKGLPHIGAEGRAINAGVGLLGGIMGGLGGLTGPAPALWAVLKGWDRATQRSVIQGFNLAMQATTMLTYLAFGTVTAQALALFPVVAITVLIPTLVGIRLYRRFSDQKFRQVVLGLLALSGVILIVQSLPRLI